jgi:2-enoate reductase
VKVITETEATAGSVLKMKPDAVIIATGSVPQKPKEIPGIDQPIVLTEDEAIRKGPDELGDKVVIIGGRKWGPELALWLAEEEKKVTVLEETDGPLGIDMKDTERRFSLPIMFRDRKIQALLGVKILEVKKDGVSIQDKEGKTQFIEADNVVVALKRVPNRKLVDELRGKVPELYDVGDCRQPLYVFYATHGAAHIARKI